MMYRSNFGPAYYINSFSQECHSSHDYQPLVRTTVQGLLSRINRTQDCRLLFDLAKTEMQTWLFPAVSNEEGK
jgi:hypothetical protein